MIMKLYEARAPRVEFRGRAPRSCQHARASHRHRLGQCSLHDLLQSSPGHKLPLVVCNAAASAAATATATATRTDGNNVHVGLGVLFAEGHGCLDQAVVLFLIVLYKTRIDRVHLLAANVDSYLSPY